MYEIYKRVKKNLVEAYRAKRAKEKKTDKKDDDNSSDKYKPGLFGPGSIINMM